MLKRILCLIILVFILAGCGKKSEEVIQEQIVIEGESEPEEQKEELLEPEESLELEEQEESLEEEQEIDEFSIHLEEFYQKVNTCTYAFYGGNKSFKFSYYAEDINGDGFPEVFQVGYNDITTALQDLKLVIYIVMPGIKYDARMVSITECRKNALGDPEGGAIDFSFTSDGSNLLISNYSVHSVEDDRFSAESQDHLFVYKDNEFLYSGERSRTYTEREELNTFYVMDASYKAYLDQEHYENFDIGTYDKTLTFTADCGWFTVDEALEHLGKFPTE